MKRFTLTAAFLALLAAVSTAHADPLATQKASGWQTTIIPAPGGKARRLETGSLPPSKPAKPTGSLAKGHGDAEGLASYYWQGQKTASGEQFDKSAMTAAHRTLPFGTRVRVTHLGNGKSVVVRINDRGPFKPERVIDLSFAAAGVLDMHKHGLAKVKVEVVE